MMICECPKCGNVMKITQLDIRLHMLGFYELKCLSCGNKQGLIIGIEKKEVNNDN